MYAEPSTRERVIVGYDFRTGAWYKAFGTFTGGVEPNGTTFTGRPAAGQIRRVPNEPRIHYDTTLEEHFPFVITRDFVRRPEIVRNVERVEDRFRVVMRGPRGFRWLQSVPGEPMPPDADVVYWVDARGLIVQADNYNGHDGRRQVWNYDAPDSVVWGVADSVNAGTRIRADFRTSATSDPSQFAMESVEKLAVSAFLMADRQPLWFGKSVDAIVKAARAKRGGPQEYVAPGHAENSAPSGGAGATANKPAPRVVPVIDPPRPDRTQAYLAFGGMGILACAGALWWWRRKG